MVSFARAAAHVIGKALGIERAVGEKVQPLGLHRLAASAIQAPQLELEIDAVVAAAKIAHPPALAVAPARLDSAADSAGRFFERRASRTTRANASPNTPHTDSCGRKPSNRYASSKRFRFVEVGIGNSCQIRSLREMPETQYQCGSQTDSTHTIS
jgi:hypothetical protein